VFVFPRTTSAHVSPMRSRWPRLPPRLPGHCETELGPCRGHRPGPRLWPRTRRDTPARMPSRPTLRVATTSQSGGPMCPSPPSTSASRHSMASAITPGRGLLR
jgi:hypothetical protein